MSKIVVITLGGTIASVPDSSGRDAVPTLSATELLSSIPHVADDVAIDVEQFRQCASGDLSFADLRELAAFITDRAAQYDGFVITQGTDTLEETSFLLDLLTNLEVPVVMTGAMRNPGLPGADGPANLQNALRVACSPLAVGLGVLVVFADEIYLARDLRKAHSASIAAFQAANTGPIGWVSEDRVRIPLVPRTSGMHVPLPASSESSPLVPVVCIGLDHPVELLPEQSSVDGVVVEAFGGGHVPGPLAEPLAALAAAVPVVFASRTRAGEVYQHTYGFTGSERDLRERGLIGAGSLDALKSRLLLMTLLAAGATHAEIGAAFAEFDDGPAPA